MILLRDFDLEENKLQLFGNPQSSRKGWITAIHKEMNSKFSDENESNYDKDIYDNWMNPNVDYAQLNSYWGGRYVGTTDEIEELRPKTLSATNKASI